jgi:predicted SAM-dependent methyltransferase
MARRAERETDLPPGLLEERGADRLHIGGTVRKAGWQVLNAQPGDHVDHLGDLRDLSRFADASFDMVYASHVFEHLGYQRDLPAALKAVARILRPGGRFFVSVPDLETLARMFVSLENNPAARLHVMRMMFGGQLDDYDFHFVGLWGEYLADRLFRAGFAEVYRVQEFGLFEDTSSMRLGDTRISLNMVATR